MKKIVIVKRNEKVLILLFKQNHLHSLQVTEADSLLGNIYLSRVQKVLPGLNAAFVTIEKGCSCFLQKADISLIKGNDEIPVQIISEAGKNKPPAVSCELSLSGQYAVVTSRPPGLSFSGKLPAAVKKRLKEQLHDLSDLFTHWHVIVRTNARELTDGAPLREEIRQLAAELAEVLQKSRHRTGLSLLRKETAGYLKAIRDISESDYDEIVTDFPEAYDDLKPIYGDKVRFYQDEMLSLSKLYSVETHLQHALAAKVWLDCGGFLVIEPTEALTVIDVNTGKFDNKKFRSFLPINKQAAEEITRQLRIRNLAGIIIIDFINMEAETEAQELLAYLRELVKNDPVKTSVIDMTPLGLVEITRKKVNKMLSEALR